MLDAALLKDLVVQPMTIYDLDEVIKIEGLSYMSPWSRTQFEKELQNPFSFKYTAKVMSEGRERIAAYIIFWIVADEAHILNIATNPDFRRKGMAKSLLYFTIDRLQESGVNEVFLEVRLSNTGAQKLYRDIGFRDMGIRKGYYGDNNEDAIVMSLKVEDFIEENFERN